MSTLKDDRSAIIRQKYKRVLLNTLNKFVTVYVIKTLIDLVGHLRKPRQIWNVLLSNSNAQCALSIAGFSTSYPMIKEFLELHISPTLCPGIAGGIASLWLLADRKFSRTASLSQIMFVRTVHFALRVLTYAPFQVKIDDEVKPSTISRGEKVFVRESKYSILAFLRQFVHNHGDKLAWIAVCSHVTYSNFARPENFTKSYFKNLMVLTGYNQRFGKRTKNIIFGMSRMNLLLANQNIPHQIEFIPDGVASKDHYRKWISALPKGEIKAALRNCSDSIDIMPDDIHHDNIACSIMHPGHNTCIGSALQNMTDIFSVMMKTYAILNGASLMYKLSKIMYKRYKGDRKVKMPVARMVLDSAVTAVRSCLMISAQMGLAIYGVCFLRQVLGREMVFSYGLAGALATPTSVIAKAGRLVELNIYSVCKCLETFWIGLHKRGIISYSQKIQTVAMIPVAGILATIIEEHRYAVTGFMSPVFIWAFGVK